MSHSQDNSSNPVAAGQGMDPDSGPERDVVPDGTRQAGNAASTSPGGGEMGVAPISADNRNTNIDRDREEAAERGVVVEAAITPEDGGDGVPQ